MTTLIIILVLVTGLVGALSFVLSLAREEGALNARLNQLQKDADYSKKQAEEMLKDKSADEVADSLDRGEF
ncbi:MAG: hypothetical protein EB015_16590 [Methylocystaceae bacterium]|nr:hypothetical protein [Methylocystaceae bacterium]